MALLFINCPNTGEPISTGMDFPKNMDLSGFENNSIQCPLCGEMHTWNGSEAFFAEN